MRGLKPQHVIYIADHLKKIQVGMLWGWGELGGRKLATLLIIIEIHSRSLNIFKYCGHFSLPNMLPSLFPPFPWLSTPNPENLIYFHLKLDSNAQDIEALHWVERGRFSHRPASRCIANIHTYILSICHETLMGLGWEKSEVRQQRCLHETWNYSSFICK